MIKKIISRVTIIFAILFLSFGLRVYGASLSGNSDVNVGELITLTFNFGTAVGAYDSLNVSYDTNTFEFVSGDSVSESIWWDQSVASLGISTKTYTFRALKAGSGRISVIANGVVSANENMDRIGTISAEKYITVVTPKTKEEIKQETGNNQQGGASQPSSNSQTASSNNYLKYLQISEEGLTPVFSKYKTEYSLYVNSNVNSIDILARSEDSNATVQVTGNNNLADGENKINIKVTAQNGYYRVYTIIVTRAQDIEKANAYLENLVIEGLSFSPEFQSEILEYDIGEISTDIEKINVLAFAKKSNTKIDIQGADSLIVGEGIITIKVTAEDGVNAKEYKIKYNRIEKTNEDINEEVINALENIQNSTSKKELVISYLKYIWLAIKKNYLLVLMYVFIVFEFIQIVILRRKIKKMKRLPPFTDPQDEDKKDLTSLSEEQEESRIKFRVNLDDKKEIEQLEEMSIPLDITGHIEDSTTDRVNGRRGSLEKSREEINNGLEAKNEIQNGIKLIDLEKNEGPKDELTFNIFENLNEEDIRKMLEEEIDKS